MQFITPSNTAGRGHAVQGNQRGTPVSVLSQKGGSDHFLLNPGRNAIAQRGVDQSKPEPPDIAEIWIEVGHRSELGDGIQALDLRLGTPLDFLGLVQRRATGRSTPTPSQLLHRSLEAGRATGPNLNVPTVDLDVTTAAVEHEAAGGADGDVGGGALDVDGFGCGDGDAAALGLHVDVAAGCMKLYANVLHGMFGVFGFTPGEQADAVFDSPCGVALAQ